MPTLSEWFACEGLPLKKCNAYRQRHGLPVLAAPENDSVTEETVPVASLRRSDGVKVAARQALPSFFQRAMTFMKALRRHQSAGFPVCNQQQLKERLEICQACDQFDGQHCQICGCRCGAGHGFLNKLSWADASCPDPRGPKWGSVSGSSSSNEYVTVVSADDLLGRTEGADALK